VVQIAPNFYSFSRRVKVRITGYVSLDPTKKTDKKTSKMYPLFLLTDLIRKPKKKCAGSIHFFFGHRITFLYKSRGRGFIPTPAFYSFFMRDSLEKQ